ncbi:hypothetical protein GTR02_19165, partial [Kineococcus sp. R8]|uniref:hypothetical protein n=1 Tax=Kineococcus siccus TaxID=2696567 RepID=UPI001412DF4C
TPPTPATTPANPAPCGWVLLAHDEVGLLHRLRGTVAGSAGLVLLRMGPGAALPRAAQVGVGVQPAGPGPTDVRWFSGLGAADVDVLLGWLGAPGADLTTPPPTLRARVTAVLRHRIATQPAAR